MTDVGSGPEEPHRPPSLADAVGKKAGEHFDQQLDKGFQAWRSTLRSEQKVALSFLVGAALLGPVGMPILQAIQTAAKPELNRQTASGVFWLAVLTLPLFAYLAFLTWGAGRFPIPGLLIGGAILAQLGGWFLAGLGAPALSDGLYCFADIDSSGILYERACRVFDHAGFLAQTSDSMEPSRAPEFFGWLVVYVADARGLFMAICGAVAGVAAGMLLRDGDA